MTIHQDSHNKFAKSTPLRIGILGSTRGTSLQPIIDAIEQQKLNAQIVSVISNKAGSGILDRAKKHNIQTLNFVGIIFPHFGGLHTGFEWVRPQLRILRQFYVVTIQFLRSIGLRLGQHIKKLCV